MYKYIQITVREVCGCFENNDYRVVSSEQFIDSNIIFFDRDNIIVNKHTETLK